MKAGVSTSPWESFNTPVLAFDPASQWVIEKLKAMNYNNQPSNK
jgi:hypothetical protein